jgi:peptidoglycan/LPS O-acetylase OafA/YrhL
MRHIRLAPPSDLSPLEAAPLSVENAATSANLEAERVYSRSANYRPDIDGLRALAIILVVAFHAAPGRVHGGFVGVDIFFVISGFLISSIILGDISKGVFSISEFYRRRIKRIFPSTLLVLFSCLLIAQLILIADEYTQLGKHVAGGAAFVSNLILWSESGYFDNDSETKPLLHLWSLGIEEQFYIVWPAIIVFFGRKNMNISLEQFPINLYHSRTQGEILNR